MSTIMLNNSNAQKALETLSQLKMSFITLNYLAANACPNVRNDVQQPGGITNVADCQSK